MEWALAREEAGGTLTEVEEVQWTEKVGDAWRALSNEERAEADKMPEAEKPCPDCGEPMALSEGPCRTRLYRGQAGLVVPPELKFWACPSCGAEWLTGSQIDALSDAFEEQLKSRSSK